ncbi:hypothetical protein [Thalassobellus suaedae]|uniref:Uncharacterized protein n=1 Tax=Thalassobellus suaedae TaxID=3074124 RepID=A0ABY9XVL8_9FLAO|nr:hypothetical protein RHP51_04720 [Flavobacteriaceae bacterium HL-DH14]
MKQPHDNFHPDDFKKSPSKINTKYLGLRIIAFIPKLAFTLFWFLLIGFMVSVKWLIFGSVELYFGKGGKDDLVRLIEQNEKIIKHFKL